MLMERPSQDVIKQMQEDALSRLQSRLELIAETYEANRAVIETKKVQDGYWCTGDMKLTSVIVNTGIKINNLEFRDFSEVLQFKGTSWGIGVGYGTSFGTGIFYERPNNLIARGKVSIELAFAIIGGGIIQTTFFDEGGLLGAMNFVGGGGGAGIFFGSGKFTRQ
jgi:hypothetical protein